MPSSCGPSAPAASGWTRPAASRGSRPGRSAARSQLQQLQDRFWDVDEERRWRVVTVLGDAGVGKSRLLFEFDRWLAEISHGVWWFRGRAAPVGPERAQRPAARRGRRPPRDPATATPPAVGAGEARGRVRPGARDRARPPPQGPSRRPLARVRRERQRLRGRPAPRPAGPARAGVGAPGRVLRPAGRASPRWSCCSRTCTGPTRARWPGSTRPTPRCERSRVLVVATARPSLLERHPHWGEGLGLPRPAALEPLSRRESSELLGEILQRADHVPSALDDLLVDHGRGQPLPPRGAGEVARRVRASSSRRTRPGTCDEDRLDRVTRAADAQGRAPGPTRRADPARAPRAAAGVGDRAGVLGRRGRQPADRAGRPRRPPTRRWTGCAAARSCTSGRSRPSSGTREFLFKHAVLRDVAYDSVLRAQRQVYHGLAARWLEQMTERNERTDEYAALIAGHYDNGRRPGGGRTLVPARRPAGVLGPRPGRGHAAARPGGRRSCPSRAELRFDVILAREGVLDRLGDRDAQRQRPRRARRARRRSSTTGARIQLLLRRASWHFHHSEYAEQAVPAQEAVELAREAAMLDLEADALLWWGHGLTWKGDHERGQGRAGAGAGQGPRGRPGPPRRREPALPGDRGQQPERVPRGDRPARGVAAPPTGPTTTSRARAPCSSSWAPCCSTRAGTARHGPAWRRACRSSSRRGTSTGRRSSRATSARSCSRRGSWAAPAASSPRGSGSVSSWATARARRWPSACWATCTGAPVTTTRRGSYLMESLEMAYEIDFDFLASDSLLYLALEAIDVGDADEAVRHADSAIAHARKADSPLAESRARLGRDSCCSARRGGRGRGVAALGPGRGRAARAARRSSSSSTPPWPGSPSAEATSARRSASSIRSSTASTRRPSRVGSAPATSCSRVGRCWPRPATRGRPMP